MADDNEDTSKAAGYKSPLTEHRFKKGKSGNPNGRPKHRHKEPPYEAVLGQIVTVSEDGTEHQITAEDAFLKAIFNKGVKGDTDTALSLLNELENLELSQEHQLSLEKIPHITIVPVAQGSVSHHLRGLKILKTLYAKQPNAVEKIEHWIVELALERLGDRKLSLEEQKIVYDSTRRPEKMNWPSWWQVTLDSGTSS